MSMKLLQINSFIILFFLIPFLSELNATHIVGGSISYECLDTNQYLITVEIYRDCFAGQAAFDEPLPMVIYSGMDGTTKYGPTQMVALDSVENVSQDTDICPAPQSNICVERGIYEQVFTLPFSVHGYHISYQRCCRNNSVSNLIDVAATGATYTMYISAEAQQTCNNSPTFDDFPPIIVCANEDVGFDHSATDAENDKLVYSFCAPLSGASQANPLPDSSPPPYTPVNFLSPYTPEQPLGDMMTIDTLTGIISGTPNSLGQFVASVCVEEYRQIDNLLVLLSTVQREFEVNVVSPPVSITSPDFDAVNIFPNPATDIIQIDMPENTSNNHIEIFDTLGKQIYSAYTNNATQMITVSEWNAGIYFVYLNSQSAGKFLNIQ